MFVCRFGRVGQPFSTTASHAAGIRHLCSGASPPNCCNRASRCANYRYPVTCGKYLFVRYPVVGVENAITSPAHTHGFSTVNHVTQRIDEHMLLGHHVGEPVRIVLVKVLENGCQRGAFGWPLFSMRRR